MIKRNLLLLHPLRTVGFLSVVWGVPAVLGGHLGQAELRKGQ